ncbi:HD domain-containing phosphohydrolase [Vibrio sp. 10N]|uniref:HD domain-containing phosphohydrolase n=1 Tax=Vibrio sp. 10N TaxID=3058938 RepID=UPI0030C65F5E
MSKQSSRVKKLSIRHAVALLFIVVISATAILSASLIYSLTKQREVDTALSTLGLVSSIVSDRLEQFDDVGEQTTNQLAYLLSTTQGKKSTAELIEIFGAAFVGNDFLHSIYVGFDDDHFVQLFNLEADYISEHLDLIEGEAWMVVEHLTSGEARIKTTQYFLDTLELSREVVTLSNYYPTKRGWYTRATPDSVSKSQPYLFHNIRISGQTFSKRLPQRNAVVGVDISLAQLGNHFEQSLGEVELLKGAEVYVSTFDGRIIGSSHFDSKKSNLPYVEPMPLTDDQVTTVINAPTLTVSNQLNWEPIDFAVGGQPFGYSPDLFRLISDTTGLQFQFVNGLLWSELVEDFQSKNIDILQSIAASNSKTDSHIEGNILFELDYAVASHTESATFSSLADLSGKTIGMIGGWSVIEKLVESYPEITVYRYESYSDALKDVHERRISGVLDNRAVLTNKLKRTNKDTLRLQGIEHAEILPKGFTYVTRDELRPYVEIINQALQYLKTKGVIEQLNQRWLRSPQQTFGHVNNETLLSRISDSHSFGKITAIDIDDKSSYVFVDQVNTVPAEYLIVSLPEEKVLGQVYKYVMYNVAWTLAALVIMVPIVWYFSTPLSNPIYRLVKETDKVKRRQYDQVEKHSSPVREVDELSTAIFEMSQSLNQYQQSQEEFIESIIQLIAKTIDSKSPYTGGHCLRVPELALMLVDAAEQAKDPVFENFHFKNDAERREFRIAAWLHDCGKITTPEYVVDKGTKLETNYNRINEVRTRFEVLWRDAEIEALKSEIDTPENKQQIIEALQVRQQMLREQFAFVANINIGGEFLNDQDKERLIKIAKQPWQRYFDNRLGLSPVEEERMSKQSDSLPVTESLLSDKIEHVIHHHSEISYPPELGIKVDVPEHLYNLGELHNLTISRGTLTAEERFKINEHMITGIQMLSSIPFPEDLQNVERIATTHHETMKGTGYPRRLTGDELSIPERILAVSDIFEALTASDRPYKKAKTISQSLDILHNMALDNHVDIEVFRLFVRSKVYMDYANQFLEQSQIDTVDESKYLSDS